MSLGTLVVNELRYEVTAIRLESKRIFLTAHRMTRGQLTVHPGDQAVLFAPDGTQVLQCRLQIDSPMTATARPGAPPARMTIVLPIAVDEVVGVSRWEAGP